GDCPHFLFLFYIDMEDQYDVIIIGGGMSGALCAYTLEKEGLKIAVVDKGRMGKGVPWLIRGYCNSPTISCFMN
ncbi:FAD-dependent oxidoreductase, partial [Neobacillus drentensis]|uniref:FAD-dependent oxidoreductase n=1 Tax=Neobacillus drentensis TaxID=220684 RepID=UPI002FFEF4E8